MTSTSPAPALTAAQAKALVAIKMAGTLYAYNGVSITTAEALESAGLVTITRYGVRNVRARRGTRDRYVADWSVRIREA